MNLIKGLQITRSLVLAMLFNLEQIYSCLTAASGTYLFRRRHENKSPQ